MVNPIQEAIELSRQEEESEEPQQCNPDALDFVRSIPFCGHSFLNRDQINLVTAYVDASNVYGSTPEVANALRNNNEGQMKTSGDLIAKIITQKFWWN